MKEDTTVTFFELLEEQRQLQNRMGWPTGHGVQGVKENLLALQVELVEVLQELPWKCWKNYPETQGEEVILDDPTLRRRLATEFTDVLQFWANAAATLGLTPEELSAALRQKWEENHQRVARGIDKGGAG